MIGKSSVRRLGLFLAGNNCGSWCLAEGICKITSTRVPTPTQFGLPITTTKSICERARASPITVETETRIREAVRDTYSKVASRTASDCSCSCCSTAGVQGPNEAESLRAGCGHPVSEANIRHGEVVLDLGSGAGADAFQASKLVGPFGKIIGVDATPEMIWKARDLASKQDVENVEFRLGEIEHLPIEPDSIDLAISNCVLNLLPDKLMGFKEILRVLKPGGRIRISDLVTSNPVPRSEVRAESWAACVEGAIAETEYLQLLRQAGFEDVRAVKEEACGNECCTSQSSDLRSVAISGIKRTSV